jgi:hypothetical protein
MRLLLLALALASCAAYADGPAVSDGQAAKAAAPVTTSASQSVAVAASAPEPERKMVCQREQAIGSNVTHKVCRYEQTEGERAQGLSDLRNNIDRVLPTHHGS